MHPIIVSRSAAESGAKTMNRETIDEGAMLALNNEHQAETSELDGARLHALVAQGFHVGLRNAGRDAFLIAFDQDAISASPNFQWFKSRYKRFVYVDRVIVAPGISAGSAWRGACTTSCLPPPPKRVTGSWAAR
jgi:predicted GNAT superfamily acetyltransferase